MGGDQAYKGFGLSFMIEMLTGALSGGMCAIPNPPPPMGNCVLFVVMAPGRLGGLDHLHQEVSQLEEYVRGVPLKDGVESIMLPGDPERRAMKQRLEQGIPLDEGNWSALLDLANSLQVAPPSVG
jgi:uncharacterized oxidoreductase